MGEVYLAEDTQLDRKVALNIQPADVAQDEQSMRRFVQEAKAASALIIRTSSPCTKSGKMMASTLFATQKPCDLLRELYVEW